MQLNKITIVKVKKISENAGFDKKKKLSCGR
jgi:hypothetical protein